MTFGLHQTKARQWEDQSFIWQWRLGDWNTWQIKRVLITALFVFIIHPNTSPSSISVKSIVMKTIAKTHSHSKRYYCWKGLIVNVAYREHLGILIVVLNCYRGWNNNQTDNLVQRLPRVKHRWKRQYNQAVCSKPC